MILHVDMDAYYASVEERDCPRLKVHPLIVSGAATGRGVVAAANYRAREFGIHSAMPAATAFRLCPQLVSVPLRMDHYAAISRQIREIFERFTPLVEPLSLDEAFLDVTGSEKLFGPSPQIGRQIQKAIFSELGLAASVGVAPNKFLAKVASDLEKPNGFVVVDPARIQEFLDPLPVGRLWGVGRVTNQTLQTLGVETIANVRAMECDRLVAHFGESGRHLWKLARGLDDRAVVPDRAAKSVSHETTFPVDLRDPEILRAWTLQLADQVARRLRHHNRMGRTVQMKIRFASFETITRAKTLGAATNATQPIASAAVALLTKRLSEPHQSIRLLGVGVSNLDESARSQQLSLFDTDTEAANEELDTAADRILDRFGSAALVRGSTLRHETTHKPLPRPEVSRDH